MAKSTEYSEASLIKARSIINKMMLTVESYNPLESDLREIPLVDFYLDILNFVADMEISKISSNKLPVEENDGTLIPLSLTIFGRPSLPKYAIFPGRDLTLGYFHRYMDDFYHNIEIMEFGIPNIKWINSQEVREIFLTEATKSFAHRLGFLQSPDSSEEQFDPDFGGQGGEVSPPSSTTPLNFIPPFGGQTLSTIGCLFTVTSNTPGLNVHWSGAYYKSKKYFGGPTTPVTSALQAGKYIFAVDGGPYVTDQWDNSPVTIPGTYPPTKHLNF